MSVLLVYYLLLFLLLLAAAALAYRVLSRRSRLLAALCSSLLLALLALLVPVPIHGGFTVVGAMLFRELGNVREAGEEFTRQRHRRRVMARFEDRFAGTLGFRREQQLDENWWRVSTEDSQQAWYDAGNHLLWSGWLALTVDSYPPSLESAKERCRQNSPTGHWALASETENYLLWKSGGRELLPRAPASTLSYIASVELEMEMTTYSLRASANNAAGAGSARDAFAVRCVALGAGAPHGGYVLLDVPLEDWNRYQLSK